MPDFVWNQLEAADQYQETVRQLASAFVFLQLITAYIAVLLSLVSLPAGDWR